MSEPVSPVAEDVLSSIRRMVTVQPAPVGRLLLTPAQRVQDRTAREDAPAETEVRDIPPPFQPRIEDDELAGLVRRMITEELRGELGEQVTRNIRKLVRSEIDRALAAKDLK